MNTAGGKSETLTVTLHDLRDTALFGQRLGEMAEAGDVILLTGNLGAGKTTLTQYVAQGLRVPADYYVTSPSYNLLHEYPGRLPLYHLDCYRLNDEDEVEEAGLAEYLVTAGVTIVEWPDRLGGLVPRERLDLFLTIVNGGERMLELRPCGQRWLRRSRQLVAGLSVLSET